MTDQPSEPSKDKAASLSWELDPLYEGHPVRSRICNAWEVLSLAIDRLPIRERHDVLVEMMRRFLEKDNEVVRQLERDQDNQSTRHNR